MDQSDIPPPDFILLPNDVVQVRAYLLQRLPAELANVIIDEAEYWPRLVNTFRPGGQIKVSASDNPDNRATRCCLLSEKIPGDEYGVPMKIVKVQFKIESHDQGWCSENNFPTRYEGSWTWFEAAIVRDFVEQSGEPVDELDLIQQALEVRQRQTKQRSSGSWDVAVQSSKRGFFGLLQSSVPTAASLVTVKNSRAKNDVWDIQRNVRAQSNTAIHEIVWTRDGNATIVEEAHFKATGSKLGAGFIDALQGGDRIAILARALFPGWSNFVTSIELEIYFSV